MYWNAIAFNRFIKYKPDDTNTIWVPDRVCESEYYVHVLKKCQIPSVANVYIAQNEAWRGKMCVCVFV